MLILIPFVTACLLLISCGANLTTTVVAIVFATILALYYGSLFGFLSLKHSIIEIQFNATTAKVKYANNTVSEVSILKQSFLTSKYGLLSLACNSESKRFLIYLLPKRKVQHVFVCKYNIDDFYAFRKLRIFARFNAQ